MFKQGDVVVCVTDYPLIKKYSQHVIAQSGGYWVTLVGEERTYPSYIFQLVQAYETLAVIPDNVVYVDFKNKKRAS